MADDIQVFIDTVFGNIDGHYFHFWQSTTKHSFWFNRPDKAIQFLQGDAWVNLYVGIGLMPAPQGIHRRMYKDEVEGIVGLYADIDIAGQGHDKHGLPPDEATARAIIDGFPLAPTVIIHSGGGLQAWWVFKEPWIFESPQEREIAELLSFRFNYTFKQRYSNGFTIDSIFNLDRLGRMPGTTNRKEGRSEAISHILQVNGGNYYNPEDIDQYCLAESEIQREKPKSATCATTGEAVITESGLTLDLSATPNPDIILELSMSNDKFAPTWKKERTDLNSASEYDYSLASIAMHVGIPDQDIVDMLIAWRRKHGMEPEKCLRASYVGMTLANIRKSIGEKKIQENIKEAEAVAGTEYDNMAPDQVQETAKKIIKTYTGLDLVKLEYVHYPETDDRKAKIMCWLETKQYGRRNIGDGEALETKYKFKRMLVEMGAKHLPDIDRKSVKWRDVLNAFLKCRVDRQEEEEYTELGYFKSLIPKYLSGHAPLSNQDVGDSGKPCIFKDSWWISKEHFAEFLRTRHNIKYHGSVVARMFRNLGIKSQGINVIINDERTTRSYYEVPKTLYYGGGRKGSTLKMVVNNE